LTALDAYAIARDFLFGEAELLDARRFEDWLALLAPEVCYQAPVRVTRERSDLSEFSDSMFHFDESQQTLRWRVERLRTEFAWAEDPPSRTRHFVSNIRVQSASADRLEVASYLLLYRNRGTDSAHDLLSCERLDRLRQIDSAWKLERRQIYLDQSTIGTKNLGIFL